RGDGRSAWDRDSTARTWRKTKTAASGPRSVAKRRSAPALRLAALVVVHVVGDAEARAGGGVHLLGGVDRVLQLGDPILHLRQLLFDLVLEIADLLLRDLERRLVELALLIGDDRHRFTPSVLFPKARRL